jgi:hypothetical protein
MSIDDERELRRRLDGALETITPSPAPVAATLRRGRTIRTRRRIGVAAGLAAAVGVALAAPGLVHLIVRQTPEISNEHKWVLSVYPPGPHPSPGEIAWGTINGKRWQIVVTSGTDPAGQCLMIGTQQAACAPAAAASEDPSLPVALTGVGGDGLSYQFGVVQPGVARVVVTLADGSRLTLYPYRKYGQRWVGFVLPSSLAIVSSTVYSEHAELAYAIAYDGALVTWLRPGEAGLPRATYVIAAGVVNGVTWSDVVHVGPWGYCLVKSSPQESGSDCLPAPSASGNAFLSSGPGPFNGPGQLMDGTASSAVAYVVGTLTDGGTVRARAVAAGGPRFWAWVVPPGERLRRVVFYSASGRQVAVQSGARYNPGL